MKTKIAILMILMLGTQTIFAQRKIKQMDPQKEEMDKQAKQAESRPWTDRLVYGGNVGLTISTSYSFVLAQPLVGYKVTDNFIAGAGFTYIYWKQSYSYTTPGTTGQNNISISDNVYGLNFFARHSLFGPAFAHIEYQPMNFTSYNGYNESKRIWTNALYLGGGINQSTNGGRGAYVLVLYDILWQDASLDPRSYAKSFYQSPWNIRVGFMF